MKTFNINATGYGSGIGLLNGVSYATYLDLADAFEVNMEKFYIR